MDPYYPIFVLVGLLVDEEHYETVIVPEMAQIKRNSKLALIHCGHEYAWGPLEEGYWFPLL